MRKVYTSGSNYRSAWSVLLGTIAIFSFALTMLGAGVSTKPRKIFVVVDSEGISGIVDWWGHDRQSPFYEERRRLMMGDVNAAIQGCLAGGATEVVVSDDGKDGINTIPELLDPVAKLIYGRGTGPIRLPLLHGMDESFAGIILLGFHAMEGTPGAVLAHTLTGVSESHRRYWYNGRESGEMTMYALVASHFKVPVIMVTGCEATCREARQTFGKEPVTVAVKKGLNQFRAVLIAPARTHEMIRAGAQEAVRRIGHIQPYRAEFPIQVRLQFPTKELADQHAASRLKRDPKWPGRRVDERTFEATITSPLDPNLVL